MQKNLVRHLSFVFILFLISLFSIIFFAGCQQSTDKTEAYFDKSGIEYTRFEYDANSNKTKVIWATTLTNNTIYNFDGFSVKFKLYSNSVVIGTETYNYDRGVKHGSEYTGAFNFYADGEVTSIEYVSWSAHYNSFWETYKIWFIVTIVVACVAALIYIIVMIIQDLELDDIGEFLSDNWWILFSLLVPLGGTIWCIVVSYWVPVLIVLGGIVAFVLLALIAHLIKFIVECISDNVGFGGGLGKHYEEIDEDEEFFDPTCEDVADYIDDENKLMLFNVEHLKEYCRENGIKGYSSLNKSNLVNLIVSTAENDDSEGTKQTTKKSTQKSNSNITFNDIAGLEEAKSAFKEKVVYAFEHKELYEKYGKKVGGGLLLYGLPGTGKTMFAEAASNETDALFIPIKCSDIKSKWYGESEANVKKIFEKANCSAREFRL